MTRRKAPSKKVRKAKPAARAKAARKPARKAKGGRTTIAPFVEELEVALAELRRLSKELVFTRRQVVDEEGAGRGVQSSLRDQLEALRTELKTARADLEIAQANARRIESRLEAAAEAEARARESQREAEHAADRARDELLWLRREVDRKPSSGEGKP
jgi:chromosome segregation ATPase